MKSWKQGEQWLQLICPYCKNEFKVYKSRYEQAINKKIYCTWEHYKLDCIVIASCSICGKPKKIYKSDLKIKNRGQFCSKKCARKNTPKGSESPKWKGGRIIDKNGYVRIRLNGKYVMEHRFVMNILDKPNLHIHHMNGIKADNRPENLMIISPSEHSVIENHKRWNKWRLKQDLV